MSGFTTPLWFVVLVPIAGLVLGYLWAQRRNRHRALRFSNLALLEHVMPRRTGWPRHVPAILLVVALLLFATGLAGPTGQARVPRNRGTVLLVIDVSESMRASDIEPTRLGAAQQAATRFARQLPPGINLGIVSFSGTPSVLLAPSTDRDQAVQQIRSLQLGPATATGEAIAAALNSVDTFNRVVPASSGGGPPPALMVLMSDGKQTVGRDEYAMARESGQRHIPINAVSFGTPTGTVDIDGETLGVPTDDPSLSRVAALSGGTFYRAPSNTDLRRVYDTLDQQVGYQIRPVDTSKTWFAVGTLITLLALAISLAFTQRLPA